MANMPAIDLARIAQSLGLPESRVQTVVELLDAGNTVPFITRYRKDQTGGLDEEDIRQIQQRIVKARLLNERQQTILRSIESQGKLTPELSAAILAADTTKRLEDLYLPYKPKKQTLATQARDRGLEPLALEILNSDPMALDLDARAKDFVNPDKKVTSGADALLGAGHILAEMFAERADLRGQLRAIFEGSGTLVTLAVEPEPKPEPRQESKAESKKETSEAGPTQTLLWGEEEPVSASAQTVDVESLPAPAVAHTVDASAPSSASLAASTILEEDVAIAATSEAFAEKPASIESAAETAPEDSAAADAPSVVEDDVAIAVTGEAFSETPEAVAAATATVTDPETGSQVAVLETIPQTTDNQTTGKSTTGKRDKKKKKEFKKEGPDLKAFRDYFNYREAIARVPPHRILAINRGERAKALRVRIEFDVEAMYAAIDELLVPADHPHAVFLRGCTRDALDRLILPSLEREVRRELTDKAEAHAVQVFARNLRNLLLQPPVRGRRILAIDPGYKSGCKLVAIDEFGNVLEHALMHIVGKDERRQQGRAKIVDMAKRLQLNTIVIGNGTGCRETERVTSDVIANDLADQNVTYVIVNEAGASVYSTSRLGREEFPKFDATVRGGVSIGRRLLDPLSELVKIEPPNLGVGMYQHDIKANHLRNSLDAVVESCVNFVGVDLNTASPALLRYVSGLNQLTAQRLYDYRQQNGPFKARQQLQGVSGIGEGTFVQAAGFLKIADGDNPLDATFIHPESYPIAEQILGKLGFTPADLLDKEKSAALAERVAQVDLDQLAGEIQVGVMTLRDILAQLARPGRDPRESLPPPIFKKGVLKLDDLAPGMELDGTVLNVVDFGAFVDIGLKDSGLVHISQLAGRYVQEPHEVVAVGDIVKVWVLEVDKQRRRVSLTMIAPGTRREQPPRRSDGERGPRPPRQQGGQGQNRQGRGRPPRAGQGQPTQANSQPPTEGQPQGQDQGPQQGQGRGRGQRRPPRHARPPVAGGTSAAGQDGAASAPPPPSGGGASQQGGRSGGRPHFGKPGGRGARPAFTGSFGGGPPATGKHKKKDFTVATMLTTAQVKKKKDEKAAAEAEGKKQMRTFGDLKQFWNALQEEKKDDKKTDEST